MLENNSRYRFWIQYIHQNFNPGFVLNYEMLVNLNSSFILNGWVIFLLHRGRNSENCHTIYRPSKST